MSSHTDRGEAGREATRRTVLRTTGAVAAASTGAGLIGSAAAQSDAGVDVLDLRGTDHRGLPAADELLVFAHGWLGTYGVEDQTADLADGLAAGGYEADHTVAVQWDAMTLNFVGATENAHETGATLARLIEDYQDETGGPIRLVGHSLGGRVVLETLARLDDGYEVETVAPMGAAADGSTVTEGGRWYDGIAENAGSVRNYYSGNDDTVGSAYGGWGDTALGAEGAPEIGTTPSTYTDVDVTGDVDSHTDYTDNEAVARDLAEVILSSDDAEADDPDDGGGDGSAGSDDAGGSTDSDAEDRCRWCWWL